jgi:SHS2 domain-containing protein
MLKRSDTMPYRFLEGLTMADIAFEATGATLEEMFISAADAVTNTQLENLKEIKAKVSKEFTLKAGEPERLLHDFLQELIFLKDAELLLFCEYRLKISKTREGLVLVASLKGEQLDQKKHSLLVDVKAVSWHQFKVEKTADGWKAVVIIDV